MTSVAEVVARAFPARVVAVHSLYNMQNTVTTTHKRSYIQDGVISLASQMLAATAMSHVYVRRVCWLHGEHVLHSEIEARLPSVLWSTVG